MDVLWNTVCVCVCVCVSVCICVCVVTATAQWRSNQRRAGRFCQHDLRPDLVISQSDLGYCRRPSERRGQRCRQTGTGQSLGLCHFILTSIRTYWLGVWLCEILFRYCRYSAGCIWLPISGLYCSNKVFNLVPENIRFCGRFMSDSRYFVWQEALLSPRNRATRRVSWNRAKCRINVR